MSTFLHKLLGASSRCRVVKLSWADWLAAAVGRPGSSHGTLLIKKTGEGRVSPLGSHFSRYRVANMVSELEVLSSNPGWRDLSI
jgi:hypothetical protein